jgi:hypothetical protein
MRGPPTRLNDRRMPPLSAALARAAAKSSSAFCYDVTYRFDEANNLHAGLCLLQSTGLACSPEKCGELHRGISSHAHLAMTAAVSCSIA